MSRRVRFVHRGQGWTQGSGPHQNTAVYEGRKKSGIKARRRKRPPAKALLPAVRAVDGDFQVVRSGVYLSEENAACCLVPAMPLFARD